ncbi:uncharacterized protein I206_101233 [Kwoniella pini CBS 10737]|uniref:Zn(2)-C6 fungal-type domain-containing protein n=1 Tax=Kwoniella pini CBS 10737 TaxID=1296096 RepID=A0A1B9IBG3_9TREE|nr:uncharacterized protein I206_00090 [Kwoniella pini CBS 10737]OCF52794.1 hypothetical protein I206_00090 [Kwoniella pini CBS 10737]
MDQSASGPSRLPSTPRSSELGQGTSNSADKGKRKADSQYKPKNLQACDRCRTKKTKCEPLETRRDICQACNSASLTCTFELPLTASRTKRIRNGHYQSHGAIWSVDDDLRTNRGSEMAEEDRTRLERSGSEFDHASPITIPRAKSVLGLTPLRTTSSRREGPTAISYILHSTPTLPISYLTEFDEHSNLSMAITPPDTGNGYMLVTTQNQSPPSNDPPSHVIEALRSPSWTEVVNRLVETYLVHISPLLPIVIREDMPEVTQTLCHVMAAVAAARRNCPKEIFDCLNYIATQEMYEQDTLSEPNKQNVQTLLVACLVDELALQNGSATPSGVSRTRLTAAIRLAQDLSMDQLTTDDRESHGDRRIWQCAVILDQWNAARTGVRPIIPSTSLLIDSAENSQIVDNPFFDYLFSLTLTLSRILAKVYGPKGITNTRSTELQDIRVKLLRWREELPSNLRFNGSWSSLPSGILHLLHTTATFLLYRPFMRWSFICPPHIDLSLDIPVWLDLNPATRQALEWATNQDELADLLFFGPYALSLMSLVQYHAYARRREWDGVVILEKFRETATRWIEGWGEGRMPLQTAQLQVISLLYACAQKASKEGISSYDLTASKRGLNPTPGVLNRLPETVVHGVTFLRDPTHPRGGVLVATQKAAQEIKDLPPDTVIIGGQPHVSDIQSGSIPNLSGVPESTSNGNPMYQMLGGSSTEPENITNSVNNQADGRISMSTPDWDAIVSSLTYPLDGNNPPGFNDN